MAAATMAQAQKPSVPEGSDVRQRPIRSPSTSSDVTVRTTYLSVPHVNPSPAYVAQTAASELITTELERTVLVSNRALTLVNEFLDQVLYNILLTSRSTSLSSLKAAVPTVLKPRLGKAALRTAEEELKEYLDDDEEMEMQMNAKPTELKHDFDTELAWKLARLRCMVYTRLGDLEEEDEEELLEKEGLREQMQTVKQTSQTIIETGPASAIFLTSIVEYLGEQALYYAAQHAQKRHRHSEHQTAHEEEAETQGLTPNPGDIIVGGRDMNHVGRDSPLSRLWRSYRRNTRESTARPLSPDGRGMSFSHGRAPSSVNQEAVIREETRSPDQIPLPMSGNDVNEIEVPGLASAHSDDERESPQEVRPKRQRPTSMIVMPGAYPGFNKDEEVTAPEIPARSPLRPTWMRKRSLSSPVHASAKTSPANQASQAQEEYFMIDGTADPSRSRRSSASKGPSAGLDQQHTTQDGVFGGAAAAVAGALGLGAFGVSKGAKSQADQTADNEQANTTAPKKTVAEEMLGTSKVAPPRDAKTGSSITNESPATLKASQNRSYFQDSPTVPSEQASGGQVDRVVPQENLKPAPLRTMSGRLANSKPGTAGSEYTQPTTSIHEDVTVPPKTSLLSSSRPQSSSGAVSAAVVPPRAGSKDASQTHHAKTDSQGSNHSPHTKHLNSARDNRPGTATSSVSKRFHGKPLHVAEEDDEAKKKSLEILIRGNETLHYTLTPAAALRDEQSVNQKARTPNQDMSEFLRHTGPRNQELNVRTRIGGLNSNPPEPPLSPTRPSTQQIVTPSSPTGIVTPVSPTRARNPFGEPRDARTETIASTRDLADYARSTGPDDVKQLPKPIAPVTSTSPRPVSATPRADLPVQEPASPTGNKPANRLKYQARDARPSRADDTSQLIDFIREGPPRTDREHRISRKVAPFRSTMDSEDFNNLQGGRELISSLRESEDDQVAPSADPSVNSQSPLIISNGQTGKGTIHAESARDYGTDTDGMPKRTRRRIKDPYAIYDSDDDDDLEAEMASSKHSKPQEESLIDFLRNTGPTPSMTTQPVLASRPSERSADSTRASGARESSPHLTQSGSKLDKYRPTQPTHAAHVERNRSQPRSESRKTARFEARDAKATRADTSELAEYLKNSGPAPNAQYRPQPFILSSATQQPPKPTTPAPSPKDSNSKLFKRFSKAKK